MEAVMSAQTAIEAPADARRAARAPESGRSSDRRRGLRLVGPADQSRSPERAEPRSSSIRQAASVSPAATRQAAASRPGGRPLEAGRLAGGQAADRRLRPGRAGAA